MASKRRPSRGKKINPTLYIFCEGDTEEAYINLLKSEYRIPSIHIKTKIGRNDITKRFIDNYKNDKPTHEKDMDFLLYDLDVPKMLQRLQGINNCILLVSNPSIELWFLLHYKNQTAFITNKTCYRELENRNRQYKKGIIDDKLKEKLIGRMKDAVKRAAKQKEFENPSSTVHKLINILERLKADKM